MALIKFSTPAHAGGGFFCLASAEGAGLLFCPATYQPRTSVYSGFCTINAVIPSQPKKRLHGFTLAFPLICPISTHTIQRIHKPTIHHLRHAGGHTIKRCTSTNTRIPPTGRTLYRSAQPPYYNKAYKSVANRRPCQPGGSVHPVQGSARRLEIWHRSAVRAYPPPGGAVQ